MQFITSISLYSLLTIAVAGVDLPFTIIGYKAEVYPLPDLTYAYNELEPWIDEGTVRAHHLGHHDAYRNKMNTLLNQWRDQEPLNHFVTEPLVEIIRHLDRVPDVFHAKLRNQMGGYVNHCLYWSLMSSNPSGAVRVPNPELLAEITASFGSFDSFKQAFTTAAQDLFGSGYVWLVRYRDESAGEQLSVISTTNQDCPLSDGADPLLVIDVWEHAYYLKHQYRRAQHISDWWKLVDWNNVDKLDRFWVELRQPPRLPHEEF